MSFQLVCIGHPLLDIQVRNGEALLAKYELKANDGILAEERHAELYEELLTDYTVNYVAGGAAQNTARGAQYVLPPNSVAFVGSVGDDELFKRLRTVNKREGVRDFYQVHKGKETGACAVILTGHERSLVTSLRSARLLNQSHFDTSEVSSYIKHAKVLYAEGYVLSHANDIILNLAKKASSQEQVFALNISAPYIAKVYHDDLSEIIPYCDLLIANEAEAEAWATSSGLSEPHILPNIAVSLASIPLENSNRSRTVIITHGSQATIWVSSSNLENIHTHVVHKLPEHEIVDTNGAGDAFAGGFLGAFLMGRETEECVQVGHKLAAMCIGQVGPQYKWPKVQVL